MTAPRRDAQVRVQRDMHITIPGPVTGSEARRLVAEYLAGGRLPDGAVIVDLPPAIPAVCWIDVPGGDES